MRFDCGGMPELIACPTFLKPDKTLARKKSFSWMSFFAFSLSGTIDDDDTSDDTCVSSLVVYSTCVYEFLFIFCMTLCVLIRCREKI